VTKPELLAYLQAFTAIVALGISVWAVLRNTSATRRRDRLELNGLAVSIYPELLMLPTLIQNVRDGLKRLKARYGSLVGQSVAASFELTAQISIPPMLERNVDKLFLLGPLGGPTCLQLYRLLLQYNSTVSAVAQHLVLLNSDQWKDAVDQLEQHLTLLENVVATCAHHVAPIHDTIDAS
jgi:hypothetical protein